MQIKAKNNNIYLDIAVLDTSVWELHRSNREYAICTNVTCAGLIMSIYIPVSSSGNTGCALLNCHINLVWPLGNQVSMFTTRYLCVSTSE